MTTARHAVTVTNVVAVTGKLHTSYSGHDEEVVERQREYELLECDVTIDVHGLDERPIAGATVTAAWTRRGREDRDAA